MKTNALRHWLTTACWMAAVVLLAGNALAEVITPGEFAKSVKITLGGYTGTTQLTNYPALIQFREGSYGIRYSDMESSDYSDLRFTDSTGTNAIPFEAEQWSTTVPAPINPNSLSGCLLWLKADAGIQTNSVGGVTNWVDQSANAYSAVSMAASVHPVYVANAINGQPVVRFSGATDNYIKFPLLTTIRTVLWVIKEDSDASSSQPRFLLGDNTSTTYYDFHRGDSKLIWSSAHAPLMFNGVTELNGASIDGRSTLMPTTMSVLSVRTSGNARANTLSYDRNIGGRSWDGDVAEVIIYNRVLTGSEMAALYLYLENKYAIDIAVDTAPSLNAALWVRIPVLTNNAAIYAYWGNPAATELPVYSTNGTVWANAFAGVWHLSDTNNVITDSTALALNGSNNGTVSTSGIAGMARDWPGANYITLSASSLASISSQATVSFWQRGTGTSSSQYTIFGANNAGGQRVLQSHLPWSGSIYWDAGNPYDRINNSAAESLYKGEWSHWAFTKNTTDGTMRIYRNGAQWISGTGKSASMAGATTFKLGASASGAETYRGTIDEFSVSSVVRSADWIKASYDNQSNPVAFAGAEVDYYYDTGTGSGLQAGNGLWSVSKAFWSLTPTGSAPPQTWSGGVRAHFDASGTSSVIVEPVQAQKIIFNGTGYTLSGGSINLSHGLVANESATIKSPIILTAPQEWYVAEGKTLTIDGAGWNIAYTLTKTGKGKLTFINHNYSNCGADLDIVVKEGELRFDTAYWWSSDTTDAMRIQLMPGASLYTGNTPFGLYPWPSDGSLEQVLLDENATWTLGSNLAIGGGTYGSAGRIVLQGATALGGRFIPMYGMAVETKASTMTSRITSEFNGYTTGGWSLIVADGTAAPDLLMQGVIGGNVTSLAKDGAGTVELTRANAQQATTINAGTLLVNNTTGSGTGTGPVTINGGTLSGTGTVANVVAFGANGGTLAPGPTTGTLTVKSNVTFTASGSATNRFNVAINSATDYSKLYVADAGTVTLGNATLNATLNAVLFTAKLFIIVNDGTDPVVGTFKNLAEGAALKLGPNQDSYTIYYAANAETGELSGGNDVALVPVPKGTFIMFQ